MTNEVHAWWLMLCIVSGANVLAWVLSARRIERRRPWLAQDSYVAGRLQLLLSAGYVFGCAFRSVLPVYDVPRIGLVDTWLSSVVVGRSVATVAELCFVAQWALLMRALSQATGNRFGRIAAHAVVPLIGVAELCSWYAVLTTSNLGHVVEEAIWGLSAAGMVAGLVLMRPRWPAAWRPWLVACCVAGVGYVAYMAWIDVPMYWSRWLADEASGRPYLALGQGLHDVSRPTVVSHRWDDWRSEVVWMSLYFSAAVWLSIALVHAPLAGRRIKA